LLVAEEMIITAMLCWFDEPAALLRQVVKSAAVICDRIVAADGAYELIHDRAPESPPAQKRAIEDECKKRKLKVEFLEPRLWKGQVEKRNAVLRHAAEGSDWVMVLDADWKITGERQLIRREIAEVAQRDVEQIMVEFIEPNNPDRDISISAPNIWHVSECEITRRNPLIFRSMKDMRCEQHHWIYSAERANGTRVGLWGGIGLYPMPQSHILLASHRFEHMCLFRDDKRIQRNRLFCGARDADVALQGVER
jgi:hypothetical protein